MSKYNFNTGELENVEKLVEQTVQALKSSWNGLEMWIFVQPVKGRWSLKIVCGSWKVLKKWSVQFFV